MCLFKIPCNKVTKDRQMVFT